MLLPVLSLVFSQNVSLQEMGLPSVGGKNDFYVGNRAPLRPQPFRKLPAGAIRPEGWLAKQLQLQADGFSGHLTEISPFLDTKTNAWLSPTGEGQHGWEETPYWLKGLGDLGYVTGNKRILNEAHYWISRVLKNQAPDGWLGPHSNLTNNDGKPDMWPNMPMLFALQSYYEYSRDKQVLDVMSRYFKWQLQLPEDQFYLSYWEKQRGGDNLASVYWLYNRTGEPWLLDLARKIHRRTADWVSGVPDWHGVNFGQAFREPSEFALLDPDEASAEESEKDYLEMRDKYGQTPGGLYGADENARPGYSDPRQATETCAMVEMMFSEETLLMETGDPIWADRCEDVTFNSLPASMTPDLRGLHYLTAPNMVLLDAGSKAPELNNGGAMLNYNPWDYRCCQHNVAQGWPYFDEHLWFASDDNGLAAAIYAPCRVKARVGSGEEVSIEEKTEYPFRDRIDFQFSMKDSVRFPLTLRVPGWCTNPRIVLNGRRLGSGQEVPSSRSQGEGEGRYTVITADWKDGDVLSLILPMEVKVVHWTNNQNAVSVSHGPLTYSLQIGEKYIRDGGTDQWPAFEVEPTTPWNFGLVAGSFEVVQKEFPKDGQPFDSSQSPVEIIAHARQIPGWTLDKLGLVGRLPVSPVLTDEPEQMVTLVPMGGARLRISSFPTVVSTF